MTQVNYCQSNLNYEEPFTFVNQGTRLTSQVKLTSGPQGQ